MYEFLKYKIFLQKNEKNKKNIIIFAFELQIILSKKLKKKFKNHKFCLGTQEETLGR